MNMTRLIVKREQSGVECHAVSTDGCISNNIALYCSALNELYPSNRVLCATTSRGSVWVGHDGDGNALLNWTDRTKPEMDAETWDLVAA